MKSTLTRILVLALFASTGLLHAQDKTPIAPIEYLRPMKNSFSIGVRMIGGADVTFSGNLGATSYTMSRDLMKQLADNGYAVYNNGTVGADANEAAGNRPEYKAATALIGSTTMPSGARIGADGRFYTILYNTDGSPVEDASGNYTITGDYLMHDPSLTRNWSYSGTSQFQTNGGIHQVGMSAYSSAADPSASVNANSSASPGVELTMGRVIQRFKRFEWGVSVGFGVSEFNAKTRQTAPVKLQYITDWYDIYNTGADFKGTPTPGALISSGTTGTLASSGTFPTFATTGTANNPGDLAYDIIGADGTVTKANGTRETTNPISNTPSANSDNTLRTQDGTVDGFWQVKGTYYIMRVGPMVRIPIGKRFSAYVGAGYLAAYVGSKFRYDENVNLPDGTGTIKIKSSVLDTQGKEVTAFKSNQQYMGGYYVDANFEWWLTTRTGFFVGASVEKLGKYEQNFDGRKATVRMDNGVGWRFGITTRF